MDPLDITDEMVERAAFAEFWLEHPFDSEQRAREGWERRKSMDSHYYLAHLERLRKARIILEAGLEGEGE